MLDFEIKNFLGFFRINFFIWKNKKYNGDFDLVITYKELNEKAKLIEKQCNLQHLEIYQRFMFERILERISVSIYNENFILKGGLLLSAMLGI